MKVGIDIVDVSRFQNNQFVNFTEKYLTKNEIDYLKNKPNKYQTLAGIFACKEAILKAFKVGIGCGIPLNEIEILHENSVPFVNINETIIKLMKKFNVKDIDINISHTETQAIAICVIN